MKVARNVPRARPFQTSYARFFGISRSPDNVARPTVSLAGYYPRETGGANGSIKVHYLNSA
jgi:hypothetical protein